MRSARLVLLASALLSLGVDSTRADADLPAIARASLEQYIRPGYAAFAASAASLKRRDGRSVREAVFGGSEGCAQRFRWHCRRRGARSSRSASARSPRSIAYDRIFYWPDPKGLGSRQLRDALAKKDQSVSAEVSLAGKSVALQGLPALEYLLYGDDADTLGKKSEESSFRCTFAKSVAANIADMSDAIVDGWKDGASYAKLYLAPSPDNAAYHTDKEVTLELFKTFVTGIKSVRDQKLAKMLGPKSEEARPQLAPFWRSDLSFANDR